MTPRSESPGSFNRYFANFDTRVEPGEVRLGAHVTIRQQGWSIIYRVIADDGGFPSLEFYAVHRMTKSSCPNLVRRARGAARGHPGGLCLRPQGPGVEGGRGG